MDQTNAPRKPQRANGVKKYNYLVDTVDSLLVEAGVNAITIQAIAERAKVPMASVYHFFPSPIAACLALAERHLSEIQRIISDISRTKNSVNPDELTLNSMRATVKYYKKNPTAALLILGSEYNAQIRHSDIAAARAIAAVLSETMVNDHKQIASKNLFTTTNIGVRISDGIWSLSVANHGEITKEYEREAERAVLAYLHAVIAK